MLARKFVSFLARPTEGGHMEMLLTNGREWVLEKLSAPNSVLCTNFMPSGRSMFYWHAVNPHAPTWRLDVQLNVRMQTKLPWALLYRLPPHAVRSGCG